MRTLNNNVHKVSTFSTRACTAQDSVEVSELLRTVFAETYASELDAVTLQLHVGTHLSASAIERELTTLAYFLAETQTSILGVLKLSKQKNNKAEIGKLYVSSNARGLGVGSSLLAEAVRWASVNRVSVLWLNVWKQNGNAIHFYEQHGFCQVGHTNVFVGDVVFEDFVMEKIINE